MGRAKTASQKQKARGSARAAGKEAVLFKDHRADPAASGEKGAEVPASRRLCLAARGTHTGITGVFSRTVSWATLCAGIGACNTQTSQGRWRLVGNCRCRQLLASPAPRVVRESRGGHHTLRVSIHNNRGIQSAWSKDRTHTYWYLCDWSRIPPSAAPSRLCTHGQVLKKRIPGRGQRGPCQDQRYVNGVCVFRPVAAVQKGNDRRSCHPGNSDVAFICIIL